MPLDVVEVQLDENQEKQLLRLVHDALAPLVEAHKTRTALYGDWRRAYKALPEHKVKNFPWTNASNVVVPLIGMMVDSIVARLLRAMLGTTDFCEVKIMSPAWENLEIAGPDGIPKKLSMEKEVRDWISNFVKSADVRDRLRTLFADVAKLGDGFIKPIWVEDKRIYHGYAENGQVVEVPVVEYTGARWTVPAPDDIIPPRGFDEWHNLPFVVHVLRYTWDELQEFVGNAGYRNIDALGQGFSDRQRTLKEKDKKVRDDARHLQATETQGLGDVGPEQIFTLYELQGKWPVPSVDPQTKAVTYRAQEVILTYSLDFNLFIRTIENPFFGKARHLIRVPFLVQEHEIYGQGVAEQALQFQESASTAHNQVVDAGTAANAGLVVTSPDCDFGNEQEIYPGKRLTVDNPDKNVRVVHLNADSRTLGAMEEKSVRYAEARVGVSPYHLGMESTVVGSRATATGTTALIGEGNLRFLMSIDDIRHAIENALYLTIQLEQQMRPEGHEWALGRFMKFPQGDVRTSIGLQLALTSEKINRDIEIQNLQLLMTVLNEYYMRVMQASALLQAPGIPPAHKLVIAQVMDASLHIVKKFVERFDIENIDTVVPDLMDTINRAMGIVNVLQGVPGNTPGALPQPGGPGAPGGPGQMPPGSPQ